MGSLVDDANAEDLVRTLASHHAGVDTEKLFRPYADVLVQVPGEPIRCLYEPYIPFVGPAYTPGGLLIVATAQNLAQFGGVDSTDWRLSTGLPDAPLFRLYLVDNQTVTRVLKPQEVRFEAIPMQPFEDGILPSLAGLWMDAAGEDPPQNLDGITQRIATTNFYKHSLRTAGSTDLNPTSSSFKERLAYRDLTLRELSGPEVRILRPRGILAFGNDAESLREFAPSARWATVNDPSWVKRGMGGVATAPSGTWYLRAKNEPIPERVRKLVEGYLDQVRAPYSEGKRDATRIYLLVHYLEFRKKMSASPSTESNR